MNKETVIIVDDDPMIVRVVGQLVEKFGFDTVLCAGPLESLAKSQLYPRSILLTDLCMPLFDGMRALEMLRQTNSTISCIVMTGTPQLVDWEEAKALGVAAILKKPFTSGELLSALQLAKSKLPTLPEVGTPEKKIE